MTCSSSSVFIPAPIPASAVIVISPSSARISSISSVVATVVPSIIIPVSSSSSSSIVVVSPIPASSIIVVSSISTSSVAAATMVSSPISGVIRPSRIWFLLFCHPNANNSSCNLFLVHRVNSRVRGLFFHVSNKSKPTHSLGVMVSGHIHISNLAVRRKHVRNFLLGQIKR